MAFTASPTINPGIFAELPINLQVGDYFDAGYGVRDRASEWVKIVERAEAGRDTVRLVVVNAQGAQSKMFVRAWHRATMAWLPSEHR